LNIYLLTWIRVWMFTWHLEILLPWNLTTLCARCCCGPEEDEEDDDILDENDIGDLSEEESAQKRRLQRQESKRKTADPTLLALAENLRKSSVNLLGTTSRRNVAENNGQPALLNRMSSTRAQVVADPKRPPDMMMFWGNEDFLIDDGPGGIQMEDIGDTAESVANFRADTLKDLDPDAGHPQHVMSQSMTASAEMEMQEIDVTWTKEQNDNEPREIGILYPNTSDGIENGLAPIDQLSADGPEAGGLNNRLTVEQELANAMGAYSGGDGKKKRKRRKKKLPPIQHSTEWAY